jgi:hypothetical protein
MAVSKLDQAEYAWRGKTGQSIYAEILQALPLNIELYCKRYLRTNLFFFVASMTKNKKFCNNDIWGLYYKTFYGSR